MGSERQLLRIPGGRKNTEQPAVCRGRWDPWRDLAFLCSWDPKMEMFADAAWGWRRGRSKEQHVSSPEAGAQGLPKAGREERTRRKEGGRDPQPGAKATSTHCRLQLHTP